MTKEITKAFILQQIQDKFNLRELIPEKFVFSESVVPTYGIEQHLREWSISYEEKTITGTGGEIFFLVPKTERWVISGYDLIFMGASSATIAGVYVGREPNLALFHYLDLAAAQTTSYAVNLPTPLTLDAGDVLGVNVDGFTSSQVLRLYIDYQIEVIR